MKNRKCFLVRNHSSSSTDWELCNASSLKLVKCFKLIEDLQEKIKRQKELWRWDLYRPPFIAEVTYFKSQSIYDERRIKIKSCRKKAVTESLIPSTI